MNLQHYTVIYVMNLEYCIGIFLLLYKYNDYVKITSEIFVLLKVSSLNEKLAFQCGNMYWRNKKT